MLRNSLYRLATLYRGYPTLALWRLYQRKTKRDSAAVDVVAVIQAAQIEVIKRTEVTVDDVVAGLLAEGRNDSTPSSRAAAWAHLGTHLGMDRKGIQLRIEHTPVDDMTDAEVEAELEAYRRERMARMSPAEAKAEMQRVHGELTVIANEGS